jgi:hypothetical protein
MLKQAIKTVCSQAHCQGGFSGGRFHQLVHHPGLLLFRSGKSPGFTYLPSLIFKEH